MTAERLASDPTRACDENLHGLVGHLSSDDGLTRKQARRRLVRQGDAAVAPLLEAMTAPSARLRLEATEALLYIGSPLAAAALVEALSDVEFGVRWLAAEALIALKCDGLIPLLEGLIARADSLWFRQAAHHVLHDHYCEGYREHLSPVLEALRERIAEDTVPVAAAAVLKRLRRPG